MNINLSRRSQKLIKKYIAARGEGQEDRLLFESIDLDTLNSWLAQEHFGQDTHAKNDQKIKSLLVSLQAELLNDLCESMNGVRVKKDRTGKKGSQISQIKFMMLIIAGVIVTACQGFDGIVIMLSVLSLSQAIMLGAGLTFTTLTLVVFLGVDLVKVANTLGIKLVDSYNLLDASLLELENIKAIRKKINDYNLVDMTQEELQQLEEILSMLQKRFVSLTEVGKEFEQSLKSTKLFVAKTMISGVSCVLHFGNGFFVGQSVALYIVPIILNTTVPAFWPVVLFSSIVGLASLSMYWIVERPNLKKLVSNWFGLNEDDVESLCDKDLLDKEIKKLASLKDKVINTSRLIQKLPRTKDVVKVEEQTQVYESMQEKSVPVPQVSKNFYSFLKPPASLATARGKEDLDQRIFCCM